MHCMQRADRRAQEKGDGIENEPSSLSDGDIADARNEGHVNLRGFDTGVG